MAALGTISPAQLGPDVVVEGKGELLDVLFRLCDPFDPAFNIVTP